ncbi:MAG: cytochrome c5 family protein [Gammaproteobacteria bacterium]|nr:cytochrome c5 family protein [Gammaproteobacteria bacterium]
METTDKQFILTFLEVITALVFITLVILVLANQIGSSVDEGKISQALIERSNERIRPVGQVNLKSQGLTAAEKPVAEISVTEPAKATVVLDQNIGEKIYGENCQSCHQSGIAGAPVVGNIQEWQRRLSVGGKDKLYSSALRGLGAMPIKGGNPSLSDAEVKAAVDFMIQSSQ